MLPRDVPPSSLGFKYPENRDSPNKSADLWLEDKRRHDGADGYWRIHDDLYDVTDFLNLHPGGKSWLELTKGTDITEAFEAHHISPSAEGMLKKFHIRKAGTKRHAPYTFRDDGFYRTLKRNVREELKKMQPRRAWKTHLMIDSLLVCSFILAVLCCKFQSTALLIMAGFVFSLTIIASHTYSHQKDNFRMYYFELAFLSVRNWRITHVLSHHLLTNTIYDLEISLFEPFIEFLPTANKKLTSILASPLTWLLYFHLTLYYRITTTKVSDYSINCLIPLTLPLMMYIFGGQSILYVCYKWNIILLIASFTLGAIGLNAAHHHPDIFHDGDAAREDMDWGLHQLDAVMDRVEVKDSHFLSLITFGDHALHHFFPTFDVGTLQALHPVFKKTLKDFGVDLRVTSQWNMIKGHFQQLLKDKPNENVADLLKYSEYK